MPSASPLLARLTIAAAVVGMLPPAAASAQSEDQVREALLRAARFYHDQVGPNGAFVWLYSRDLSNRQGEGIATPTMGWIQPPGAPTIGEAFLQAWRTTGDPAFLGYAGTVGQALLRGQLHSGGWDHSIELDPAKRAGHGYLDDPDQPKKPLSRSSLDDDITQSALTFLIKLDAGLRQSNAELHERVVYALDALIAAQRPNGGWYQWWMHWPEPVTEAEFPILKASFPEEWSRVWLNDWPAKYVTNDNVAVNAIRTLLTAHRAYGEPRYLEAARRAGDFLLLAQLPAPQPAWAQQYDIDMHPCWDRPFEPPAISGHESQQIIRSLIELAEVSGDSRYLDAAPPAINYLRSSLLPDGQLARFYEMETNKPLYFQRDGKRYDLTYSADDVPDHYGFHHESMLDDLEKAWRLAKAGQPSATAFAPEPVTAADAAEIIAALDADGAWSEEGMVRDAEGRKTFPADGILSSQTFVDHVDALCRYLAGR